MDPVSAYNYPSGAVALVTANSAVNADIPANYLPTGSTGYTPDGGGPKTPRHRPGRQFLGRAALSAQHCPHEPKVDTLALAESTTYVIAKSQVELPDGTLSAGVVFSHSGTLPPARSSARITWETGESLSINENANNITIQYQDQAANTDTTVITENAVGSAYVGVQAQTTTTSAGGYSLVSTDEFGFPNPAGTASSLIFGQNTNPTSGVDGVTVTYSPRRPRSGRRFNRPSGWASGSNGLAGGAAGLHYARLHRGDGEPQCHESDGHRHRVRTRRRRNLWPNDDDFRQMAIFVAVTAYRAKLFGRGQSRSEPGGGIRDGARRHRLERSHDRAL